MIYFAYLFLVGYAVSDDELSCSDAKEKMKNVCQELECRNVMKSETYQCLLGRGKYEGKFNDSAVCLTELFLQVNTNRTKLCDCNYVKDAYQCFMMQNAQECLLPHYIKEGFCDRSLVSDDAVSTEGSISHSSTYSTPPSISTSTTDCPPDIENEIPDHHEKKVIKNGYWNYSGANSVVVNVLLIYFVFFSKGLLQLYM